MVDAGKFCLVFLCKTFRAVDMPIHILIAAAFIIAYITYQNFWSSCCFFLPLVVLRTGTRDELRATLRINSMFDDVDFFCVYVPFFLVPTFTLLFCERLAQLLFLVLLIESVFFGLSTKFLVVGGLKLSLS